MEDSYERILNITTKKGVFSYRIITVQEGYIIEPYTYAFIMKISDFKRIYENGRKIIKHYYKKEPVIIHYSSLKEEQDKSIIELFLKYLPTKEEIEEAKQKNVVSIKK